MHQTMRLKPTGPGDFHALRRLFDHPAFADWGGPSRVSDDQLRAKYLGARYPEVECFLVLVDDEPVGLTQLHVADERPGSSNEGGGLDLILLPATRGRGVGRAVVAELVRRARQERGWQRVTVDPDRDNEAGIGFWTAVGFQPEKRIDDDPSRKPYVLMVFSDPVRDRSGGDRADPE